MGTGTRFSSTIRLFLFALALVPAPFAADAEEVIYFAREIVTMDPDGSIAEAVAVRDGEIVAVGARDTLIADETLSGFTVDESFADHVITPGMFEQHVHPLLAALTMQSDAVISIEDWETPAGFSPKADGEEAFRARLSDAVAGFAHGDTRPMLVWGYHNLFHGDLSRAILDDLAGDTPVVVWQRSTHDAFLNSAAIAMLEIDQAYIDNWPSELARSQASLGEGRFTEAAFWEHLLFEKLAAYFLTPDFISEGLRWTASFYHRNGITAIAEPAGPVNAAMQGLVAANFGPDETPFNSYFIPDGRTLANMYAEKGEATLIAETEAMIDWGKGRTRFLPKQVKIFVDGAIYAQLMVMRDGYLDGHHGEWLMPPDAFARIFDTYWRAGYQIHVHCLGDGGLDVLLDALEASASAHPREDHRTVLVHFGYAQPDQIERAAALGAIVSANPLYTTTLADVYAAEGVGRERTERMVPLAEAIRAGMSVSLHSDMPMAPADPLILMAAAVNRTTPSGWTPGPDQRLTPEQALRAVTIDAAYSLRLEDRVGSIEPGKRADFTILDANPLTVDPSTIAGIGVWGTVLGGRLQPIGTQ